MVSRRTSRQSPNAEMTQPISIPASGTSARCAVSVQPTPRPGSSWPGAKRPRRRLYLSHARQLSTRRHPNTTAPLASLRAWISPDGGKTWTGSQVTPGPDRTYRVSVINHTLADSLSGTVRLKAEAHDAAGNAVQQTITDAYVLK